MSRVQADLQLDPLTGDLPEVSAFVTGIALIEQRIRLRLRRGLGEWFLDPAVGLPLIEWLTSKPRVGDVVQRIEAEIREVPGVIGTTGWSGAIDPATHRLTITGDVLTASGDVTSAAVMGTLDAARNGFPLGIHFFRPVRPSVFQPIAGGR